VGQERVKKSILGIFQVIQNVSRRCKRRPYGFWTTKLLNADSVGIANLHFFTRSCPRFPVPVSPVSLSPFPVPVSRGRAFFFLVDGDIR